MLLKNSLDGQSGSFKGMSYMQVSSLRNQFQVVKPDIYIHPISMSKDADLGLAPL